jgi:hypothetical protein
MIDTPPDHPIPEPLLATMNLQRQISELTDLVSRSNADTVSTLLSIQNSADCHRKKAAVFYEVFQTKYAPLLDEMIERDKTWAEVKDKAVNYGTRGATWLFCAAFTAVFAGICLALSAEVAAFARAIFHRGQ